MNQPDHSKRNSTCSSRPNE